MFDFLVGHEVKTPVEKNWIDFWKEKPSSVSDMLFFRLE